jgi:pSer/pThr/pTyr-binding forkhead associated (FHA) protein
MSVDFLLKILEGQEKDKVYSFNKPHVTIGRTANNDLVIKDPSISRHHALIVYKDFRFIVKDLDSSNGTRLNGVLIKQKVLATGDVVRFGNVELLFDLSDVTTAKSKSKQRGLQAQTTDPSMDETDKKQVVDDASLLIKSAGMRSHGRESAGSKRPAVQGGIVARFSVWYRGLSKRVQFLLVVTSCIMIAGVLLKAVQGSKSVLHIISDHSEQVFSPGEYGDDDLPISYGFGPVAISCKTKATFKFKYAGGRATAVYSVALINSKQEVVIEVNGQSVGYAPITLSRWSDEIQLMLPRKFLKANDINTISFVNSVNTNNPEADEAWAVELAAIVENPLPEPNEKLANENFLLAKERYQTRHVAPQNMYQALMFFKKARDYLELMPKESQPGIYDEACEMILNIEKKLNKTYRDLIFTAEQAKEYEQFERAKRAYLQIIKTFPDKEDARHVIVQELLEEIE